MYCVGYNNNRYAKNTKNAYKSEQFSIYFKFVPFGLETQCKHKNRERCFFHVFV